MATQTADRIIFRMTPAGGNRGPAKLNAWGAWRLGQNRIGGVFPPPSFYLNNYIASQFGMRTGVYIFVYNALIARNGCVMML